MPSAGRTSMPATLPFTPWMSQVFTTFFAPVSTIAIVLSPVSAATCAACAATEEIRRAADAARMERSFITLSLGSLSPVCDHVRGTAGEPEVDARAADNKNVSHLHPNRHMDGTPCMIGQNQHFSAKKAGSDGVPCHLPRHLMRPLK